MPMIADPDLGHSPFFGGSTRILGGTRVDTDELARAAGVLARTVTALDSVGLALRGVEFGAGADLARALATSVLSSAAAMAAGIPGDLGAGDRARAQALAAQVEVLAESARTRTLVLRGRVDEARSGVTASALAYGAAEETAAAAFLPGSLLRAFLAFGPGGVSLPAVGQVADPLVAAVPWLAALSPALALGTASSAAGGLAAARLVGAEPALSVDGRGLIYNGEPVDLRSMTPAQALAMLAASSPLLHLAGPWGARTNRVHVWRAGDAPPPGTGQARRWAPLGERATEFLTDTGEFLGDALDLGTDQGERVVPWVGGRAIIAGGTALGVLPAAVVAKQLTKRPLEEAGRILGTKLDTAIVAMARKDLASGELSPAGVALNRGILRGYGALEQCYPGMPAPERAGAPQGGGRTSAGGPAQGSPRDALPPAVPVLQGEPIAPRTTISGLIEDVGTVKSSVGVEGAGAVRIDTTAFPDGHRAHVVQVPGTEEFLANSGRHPHDLLADLEIVAGVPNALETQVQAAMDMANVAPGEEVVLVGHSGGALAVADMAADPLFQAKYDVTHVVAVGGPTGNARIPEATRVLTLENAADGVTGLDGARARPTENHLVVQGPTPTVATSGYGPHMTPTYGHMMRGVEQLGDPRIADFRASLAETLGWEEEGVAQRRQEFAGTRR